MKEFWNERYAQDTFVYGTEPNEFLRDNLKKMEAGKIILPCDGEGRNAVFAALLGWQVNAFDFSSSAKAKANKLAKEMNVSPHYETADIHEKEYPENSANVVALIYAHFPEELRKLAHQKAIKWLKPGGKIILEAFNPDQINNNSGGPKNVEMLYTKEILKEDFKDLNIELLEITETHLTEGKYHEGKADIIRLIATKP
ncbi:methyltransferase domain-containing protein [Marivirga arenosa]|uniref:Methyltransferase domain-containing protein n=1 Tax=Marivirga arenosa TaxID=3059076 RepID=A0AA49GFU1_9BACT|nr:MULTISPECIES: methyltransferase domain-containing protein [unclassified Marivirga]WKK81454.2 methyltransferase domain-containing protein [Marivirga sp. BKB1-2]WKK83527.2 methyltransferase domain-containing protein [Marivirga sp. ABR2-2]